MDNVLSHPLFLIVATAVAGLLAASIRGVALLFTRMTTVEVTLKAVDSKVDELGHDLRAHMADEAASVDRLTNLIVSIKDRQDD
jgi:hypothetical protein